MAEVARRRLPITHGASAAHPFAPAPMTLAPAESALDGIVSAVFARRCLVWAGEREWECVVAGRLLREGKLAVGDRVRIKDAFQEGDLEVLVGGIRAASEGLTLTASKTCVFLELDWNPARHQQAEDRIHRISQRFAVTVYYLIACGTLEEKIAALIDSKREVLNSALGEGQRTIEEQGILDAILDELV